MVSANQPFLLFFLLICGHALGDFSLQNQWVALNKERRRGDTPEPDTVPSGAKVTIWPYLLTAHSLHHGFLVFVITQSGALAVAETAVHWVSDFGKGEAWYGFHFDQSIHILSKAVWAGLMFYGLI